MPYTTRSRLRRRLTFALKDLERAGGLIAQTAQEFEDGGRPQYADTFKALAVAVMEIANALHNAIDVV